MFSREFKECTEENFEGNTGDSSYSYVERSTTSYSYYSVSSSSSSQSAKDSRRLLNAKSFLPLRRFGAAPPFPHGGAIDPRNRGEAVRIDKRDSWQGYYDKGPVFKLGERGSGLRTRSGKIQDFAKITQECRNSGELFEDPDFPCTNESVFGDKTPDRRIKWMRPPELSGDPSMFVDGVSRFDVCQGAVGNCWMVAALANLTLNDELFNRVVPGDQGFGDDYTGCFHFRIWKANRWIDVVVDDRLPTSGGELLYMKSKSGNEFWSALVEKAYAKLHGSYEALSGGSACEAMEDFSGGVTESFDLRSAPSNLLTMMLKASERKSMMSCSINVGEVMEERLESGLVAGHAYSITAVRLIYIARLNGKMPLIRIRNPWGEHEWNGAWSDGSREWALVDEGEREEIGLTFDADGEFWMSFKDFMKHFHFLEICNLGPDALNEVMLTAESTKKWEVAVYEGSWVSGATAGGCRNYLETFWANPQYIITLEDPDEDDDDNECTMIVALMQKNRRSMRTLGGGLFLTIGFAIYRIPDPDNVETPLGMNFFKYNTSAGKSHTFVNSREVTTRFKFPPGTYCIIPSTFEPNQTGDFLLRVFTEKKNTLAEHDNVPAIVPPEPDVAAPEEDPDSDKAKQLQVLFAKIAGDDLEVNCYELQKILTVVFSRDFPNRDEAGPFSEMQGGKFSLDVCRSMIALMDSNHSGKLGLEDFRALWIMIRTWRNTFKKYDEDEDGALDTMELKTALHSAGYTINNHILSFLVLRYGHDGYINFDDFIGCAVKLRCMIEIFKEKDSRRMGSAVFTIEEEGSERHESPQNRSPGISKINAAMLDAAFIGKKMDSPQKRGSKKKDPQPKRGSKKKNSLPKRGSKTKDSQTKRGSRKVESPESEGSRDPESPLLDDVENIDGSPLQDGSPENESSKYRYSRYQNEAYRYSNRQSKITQKNNSRNYLKGTLLAEGVNNFVSNVNDVAFRVQLSMSRAKRRLSSGSGSAEQCTAKKRGPQNRLPAPMKKCPFTTRKRSSTLSRNSKAKNSKSEVAADNGPQFTVEDSASKK